MEVPEVIEINLLAVNVNVADVQTPDGNTMRVARFEDPQSHIAVVLPMDVATAIRVGNALTGKGLVVPEPGLPGGQPLHRRNVPSDIEPSGDGLIP
jgi:hypothetical protein